VRISENLKERHHKPNDGEKSDQNFALDVLVFLWVSFGAMKIAQILAVLLL
jgi:hypothetical protein